ncbi:MAG TPA: hypothetical protein VEA99_17555 [Gemmatimonadaceae bacterium]|nr:hypothetical protein [Gemmatimonadaceae bacterium]
MPRLRTSRSAARAAALLLLAAPAAAFAQSPLLARHSVAVGPVFETWQLTDGITHGVGGSRLERATQWSVPFGVTIGAGSRWSIDVSSAYAVGTVTLDRADPQLRTDELRLDGLADVRARATGRFFGDQLLVTLGAVAPTGATELDPEELSALRVLSAPALSFQTPVLGSGAGATIGVVVARPVGAWAVAAGTSYEYRARYTPATIIAGLPTPDFSPGGVVHLSLGADGLLGRHGATITGSVDLFESDRLSGDEGVAVPPTRLGPVATFDARLNVATSAFRQLTLYVVDRYRSSFERDGATVEESSGNYLDAGVHSVYPVGPRTGLLVALNGRHHTGLGFDEGIQTAAIASGALTLGLTHAFANGFELAPFARGQLGRLESGDESTNVRGIAAGITLSRRF